MSTLISVPDELIIRAVNQLEGDVFELKIDLDRIMVSAMRTHQSSIHRVDSITQQINDKERIIEDFRKLIE